MIQDPHASRRRSLDQLHVPVPCTAAWDAMHDAGTGRRFCETCSKHVHDLSQFDRDQVERLLEMAASDPNRTSLCIRFQRHADGTLVTRDRPVPQVARGGWRRVAAVCATMLGLGSLLGTSSGCDDASQRLGRVGNAMTRWLGLDRPPPPRPPSIVMGDYDMRPPFQGAVAVVPTPTTLPTTRPLTASVRTD